MLMPTESNGGGRSGATQDRATQASMRLFPPVMSLTMTCNNNNDTHDMEQGMGRGSWMYVVATWDVEDGSVYASEDERSLQ